MVASKQPTPCHALLVARHSKGMIMRQGEGGALKFIEFPTPINHSRYYAVSKWLKDNRIEAPLTISDTIYQRRGHEHLREYWQAYTIDVTDEHLALLSAALPGVRLVYVSDIDTLAKHMDELTLCVAADIAVMEEQDV